MAGRMWTWLVHVDGDDVGVYHELRRWRLVVVLALRSVSFLTNEARLVVGVLFILNESHFL